MEDAHISKRTERYRKLGQGLKLFHEPKHEHPDVDIVAVPGLGANPTDCWTWHPPKKAENERSKSTSLSNASGADAGDQSRTEGQKSFNWLSDSKGLASLYPRSRIMLFDYASAWWGNFKVKATMRSICTCILDDLQERRKAGTEATRPIVFIGHSMGGIVVAKALCMAKARPEWESIVTCTTGCIFFGAPFKGSNMAKLALMLNAQFGSEAYESLLQFMRTEKNDALDEMTNDFMEVTKLLSPPIELLCVWEQVATEISNFAPLPRMLKHKYFKVAARKMQEMATGGAKFFVDKESAVLTGAHQLSMPSDHRDMVKFDSVTGPKFTSIHRALSKMIDPAKSSVRKRVHSSGQSLLNQRFVNQVRLALEGVDMRQAFRAKTQQRSVTSWLTSEQQYQKWLAPALLAENDRTHLWLTGGPGTGKSNAALAAIQHLSEPGPAHRQLEFGRANAESFMAYFLCDAASGYCTAEDVLKNLVMQMINQEDSLAHHAKWFAQNHRTSIADEHLRGTKATTTVDNLWKCLQDIIEDPAVSRVHFIISNVHFLEFGESTNAFLAKLRENAAPPAGSQAIVRKAKWLLTSRGDVHVRNYLNVSYIAAVNLENDAEYGRQLRLARRQHAKKAVSDLRSTQNYGPDLAYFVRNSIESRSEDENWIDVLCLLLSSLPQGSGFLAVESWLKDAASLNVNKLVLRTWKEILMRHPDDSLELEEILRATSTAFEPPKLVELSVLTSIDANRLQALLERCSPILRVGDTAEGRHRVTFSHPQFATHFSRKVHGSGELSDDRKKQYHGLLAIRCFKHIKSSYQTLGVERIAPIRADGLQRSLTVSARRLDAESVLVTTNEEDETDESDHPGLSLRDRDCLYPFKYVFHHLEQNLADVLDELIEEDLDFWSAESHFREIWLKDVRVLRNEFKNHDTSGMSALHVAAGIDAAQLAAVLVNKFGREMLSWTSDAGLTALHIAASNKTTIVVEQLIRAGADIEAGDGCVGTALHFAALHGKSATMSLLLKSGASVNAFKQGTGPVINAAILSGAMDAVKQIMAGDVRFDVDYTKCESPLSLSAGNADPILFQEILESEREKWLRNAKLLDQALVSASDSGRLESVRILLRFQHQYTDNTLQTSIHLAANAQKWASVNDLLDHVIADSNLGIQRDIKLDNVFLLAVVNKEERMEILKKIWSFREVSFGNELLDFALYQACSMRKTETANWLLETCRASANASSNWPSQLVDDGNIPKSAADFGQALNAAASTGNAPLLRSLVAQGAMIDATSDYSLQIAAKNGHVDAVKTLLELGADADRIVMDNDELGFDSGTALQAACDRNQIPVVEALIRSNVNPNLGGGILRHPIVSATQRQESDILALLLETDTVDLNVIGGHDQTTPLINAATFMTTEMVDRLIKRGADIDARNGGGDTALIMAARRGDKQAVELLCDRGASITYRSPQYGLASQVAAQEAHPHCAEILSERMCQTIDDYREQLKNKIQQSKKQVEDIAVLEQELKDAKESLRDAQGISDFHQKETERLRSMSSFTGQTYSSLEQQLKAMQNERAEHLKEIDSLKGQNALNNHAIADYQARVNDQQNQMADLRRRQGFKALQDERNAALEDVEAERQKCSALHEQLTGAQNDIERLQQDVQASSTALNAAKSEAADARSETGVERVWRQELDSVIESMQKEMEQLQSEKSSVEAVLSSIQEAARGNASGNSHGQTSPNGAASHAEQGYFTGFGRSINAGAGSQGLTEDPQGSREGFPGGPNGMGLVKSQPTSPATRPGSATWSPSSQTDGGFRTVRGVHRPDGSLGGYPAGKGMRRPTGGGVSRMYSPGNANEGRSMSTDSLGSQARSQEGSMETTKDEMNGNGMASASHNVSGALGVR